MRSWLLISLLAGTCLHGPQNQIRERSPWADLQVELDCEPAFGNSDAIVVEAVSPDGSWVVACQAREDTDGDGVVGSGFRVCGDSFGDAPTTLLMHAGATEGEHIDAYLGCDLSGRVVMFARGDALVVREMDTAREHILTPQIVDDDLSYVTSVHPAGTHVLYARRTDDSTNVIVERALADGAERVFAVPEGRLYGASYVGVGYIVTGVVTDDTNGDGILGAPRTPRRACEPPRRVGHDFVVEHVFAPNGDRVRDEVLAVGADATLVLRADGTLVVVLASGDTSTTVPATCASTVAAFWPEGRAVLAHCDTDGERGVTLHDPAGAHRIELPSAYVHLGPWQRGRVARIGGALPIRLDLATRTIIPDARVIATSQYGVLESRYEGDVRFRAYETITETSFVRGIDPSRSTRFREEAVFGRHTAFWHGYSVSIFDFANGRVVGTVPHPLVGVGVDGRALMLTRYPGRRGPLCWVTPTPEPAP